MASFVTTNYLGDAVILVELGSLAFLRAAVRQRVDSMTGHKWIVLTLTGAVALGGLANYQGRQVSFTPVEWASSYVGDIIQIPALLVLVVGFGVTPALSLLMLMFIFPTLLTVYFALGDGRVTLDPSWDGMDSVVLQYMGVCLAGSVAILFYLDRQYRMKHSYLCQIARAKEMHAEYAAAPSPAIQWHFAHSPIRQRPTSTLPLASLLHFADFLFTALVNSSAVCPTWTSSSMA
eukprot:937616-Pleurochrysis_carterae.AAC.1